MTDTAASSIARITLSRRRRVVTLPGVRIECGGSSRD
jgi:hypothetical protein